MMISINVVHCFGFFFCELYLKFGVFVWFYSAYYGAKLILILHKRLENFDISILILWVVYIKVSELKIVMSDYF